MQSFLNFTFKLVKILFLLSLCAFGGFLYYYLPKTNKAYLVGTEIKRETKYTKSGERYESDVRFIVARDFFDDTTLMFRNEDIAWPPYFKFDSGDLSGKVMNLKENMPESVVNIEYYGFRIPVLSMYPNAVSITIVSKNYKHTPWFNIVFLSFLFCFYLWVYFRIWRPFRKKVLNKKPPLPNPDNTLDKVN